MREDDSHHSPATFSAENPAVKLVIDLSAQMPPYLWMDQPFDYIKLATQSKRCPSREIVKEFAAIVDRHVEVKLGGVYADAVVGVHCHYGFNRTGFVIISYLVERQGMDVEDAISMFREGRAPGVRHDYFLTELRSRYGPST